MKATPSPLDGRTQAQGNRGASDRGARSVNVAQIDIADLTVGFETNQGFREAIVDVNLSIPPGQFTSIVGPSGCGKSTILNCIAGLIEPSSGEVLIDGVAQASVSRDVGYLFQSDALLPWKSVIDNISLPLIFRDVPKAEAYERAKHWLHRVKLGGFEDHYPHQLSGGMKKRVSLATVFVFEPRIMLMDEPFSALDIQTRNLMENELLDIWQEQEPTVVFITHDLEEAIGLSDRVVVLTAGPGRVKADYVVSLDRPRDVGEVRGLPEFQHHYNVIWHDLRDEVVTAYERDVVE